MNRVVVTGMGAVTPIGNNVSDFWNSLTLGRCGIDFITRYETEDSKFKLAAEVKNLNPADILDKTTVRKTDLFVQYALCAAEEAVKDSGIEDNIAKEDFSVYFGSGIGGFETLCSEHKALLEQGNRKVSPLFIPKMIDNIAAGNISIRFQAKGSCVAVSTACATGTTAIGEGYRSIKHGYSKVALCGGSEAAIAPLSIAGFGNMQALSSAVDPNGASLPFDKRRGGFVMGEGAGVLILEDYYHALRRGANIYAEVCGYGSTSDAHHVTAPSPDVEQVVRAVNQGLYDVRSGVKASKIYVNAHGTGTPMNDRCETLALKEAFGEDAKELNISSTKSMTGHMLGAAGAVEGICAIMALRKSIIPPTINLLEKDEECDLDYTPNEAKSAEIDIAISTSLGFGGHNACIAFKKIGV